MLCVDARYVVETVRSCTHMARTCADSTKEASIRHRALHINGRGIRTSCSVGNQQGHGHVLTIFVLVDIVSNLLRMDITRVQLKVLGMKKASFGKHHVEHTSQNDNWEGMIHHSFASGYRIGRSARK